MVKRFFKTFILCILTLAFVLVAGVCSAGCAVETRHPQVKITVTFNGEDYVMKFKLYRNMYPQTVKHFIELASAGFYDNTIIHDYVDSDSWIGGGYSYNGTDDEGNALSESYEEAFENDRMADYLDNNDKEEEYNELYTSGKLTASVYSNLDNIKYKSKYDAEKNPDALGTVMGEFSNNIGQEIENGALSASYGTLKMFYYPLETMQHVFVTPNKKQNIEALYRYNSATSLFMIQTSSTSTYSAAYYATFGKIKDSDVLDDLLDAIDDYIDDQNYSDEDDFYTDAEVEVNNVKGFDTEDVDYGIQTEFTLTREPIIIKQVKVTKY
ncbi:MAG: peptidylprolyl isomerase [Clostridia bacterium]|nr:peptidylprolyl isomerase [Clostridia bacterium]